MPTNKLRMNITLSKPVNDALTLLAKRDHVPAATKAARLLESALEIEEDVVLDRLVTARDTGSAEYLAHSQVWK